MKRYLINNKLKKLILNDKNSLRSLNLILGFEVRNILYKNLTINSKQLDKLKILFNKNFNLKPIYLDYGKNLGKNAFSQPIKKIKEGGNLAEFIGIMLGDGNIWNNRIRIAFDKRNFKYIDHVFNLFKKIFGIELKKEISEETNQAYLYRTNMFAVEELLNLGIVRGDKIKNKAKIPRWIKINKSYSKKCIKGLIDTDGCVYFSKRENQTYIKFTNFNPILLKDFKKITKNLGYSFAKANKNNWCLYRKLELVRFIKDIKPFKLCGDVG